jgi:hypothetical protein
MNFVKQSLAVSLTASLFLGINQAQAFWLPPGGGPAGQVSFSLNSNVLNKPMISKVTIYGGTDRYGYPVQDCFTSSASPCDLSSVTGDWYRDGGTSAVAQVVYPICSDKILESCIEAVVIGNDTTVMSDLSFARYSHEVPTIVSGEFPGLPAGGSVPIFSLPSAFGDGVNFLAAQVTARYSYSKKTGRFQQDTLHALLVPISFRTASRSCQPEWKTFPPFDGDPSQKSRSLFTECYSIDALFTNGSISAYPENFAEGTRIELKIRISKSVGGWFSGQFGDVDATLKSISSDQNLLSISANVAKVPQLKVVIPEDEIKPDGIKLGDRSVYEDREATKNGVFGGYTFPPGGEGAVNAVLALREIAGDKASAENVLWSFQSANRWMGTKCKDAFSGITGIIATNAMAYDGYQPKFADGAFDFKVAGMHYNSDGSVAVGSYDLLIRSEFARCLYGFKKAPIYGTVSVLDENGIPVVATTTVSEANGFVKLTAKGFGFSEKKIIGKLTQRKPTQRKLNTTCQRIVQKKVKETRTVKGAICPKGFVKKK